MDGSSGCERIKDRDKSGALGGMMLCLWAQNNIKTCPYAKVVRLPILHVRVCVCFCSSQAHIGSGTSIKKIGIFLDMCEGDAREFPLEIQVVGTAKVSEVIGLICWHYKNEGYEPPLRYDRDSPEGRESN